MLRRAVMEFLTSSPDVAFAVWVAGMLLVYVEFCRPGTFLAGSLGGMLALTSLYALLRHPWQWKGALLCVAAAAAVAGAVSLRQPVFLVAMAVASFVGGLRMLLPEPLAWWSAAGLGGPFLVLTFYLLKVARDAHIHKAL